MHSESGVKLQGAGPGGNVCVCLVPPGKGPGVHTLRAACRSRGSSQYDCASSGTPLARNRCLKVHVQSYHHQPTGRECSLHLQLAHLQSVLLLRQLWCPHQLQQSHLVWATGRASYLAEVLPRPSTQIRKGDTEAPRKGAMTRSLKGRYLAREESGIQRGC